MSLLLQNWINKNYSFLLLLCVIQISCNKKSIPSSTSFYYWKTNYQLTNFEKNYIQTNPIKNIYLHCFDVVATSTNAEPQGVLIWKQTPLKNINYIPTVFIKNEVFENRDSIFIKQLAQKIFKFCTQIFDDQHLKINEIQIDCDWTASTKNNYFYFLKCIKQNKIIVSNTLRLYQYKYQTEAGIAPTDYCSLMCYNMGNIKQEQVTNSILNQKDLEAYTKNITPYPKPINIALPIFNWTLLYNNANLKGILYSTPNLEKNYWQKVNDVQYLCLQDYLDTNCNNYFYKNEQIRIEQITKQQLQETKIYITKYINNNKNEIIYFDLDSTKIKNLLN